MDKCIYCDYEFLSLKERIKRTEEVFKNNIKLKKQHIESEYINFKNNQIYCPSCFMKL